MCVYVCLHVWAHMSAGAHSQVCTCMWKPEFDVCCLSIESQFICSGRLSRLTPSLSTLSSTQAGTLFLCFLSRITGRMPTKNLSGCWGAEYQSSSMCSQHFIHEDLSPAPSFNFFRSVLPILRILRPILRMHCIDPSVLNILHLLKPSASKIMVPITTYLKILR